MQSPNDYHIKREGDHRSFGRLFSLSLVIYNQYGYQHYMASRARFITRTSRIIKAKGNKVKEKEGLSLK